MTASKDTPVDERVERILEGDPPDDVDPLTHAEQGDAITIFKPGWADEWITTETYVDRRSCR